MKLAVLSMALLFGSSAAAAQATIPEQFVLHGSSGCPVSMGLNQATGGRVRLAGNGQVRRLFETRLQLVLSRASQVRSFPASIQSAEVTVHGYNSSKPGFELVYPGDTPAAQSLLVRFNSAGNGRVYSDFVVRGLASAGWLEIDSLAFANGSVWKPMQGETCAVAPNMFQLIEQSDAAGR
ncbi:MAG TPA: hypothetical protein VME18_13125 [Acidobacteriaceae bacterium]|nr:hypothetical protein [Acidobacteriaceae bacterium]